jgi:hypothetical protein
MAGHRHKWVAGMMVVHPEDAVEVDQARRAAGDEGVVCQECDAPLPKDFDPWVEEIDSTEPPRDGDMGGAAPETREGVNNMRGKRW